MKAMVLSAGVGRRMYPLTLSQPKPAITVLGRPLVVQILHWLAGHGVDEAVLNLHHRPDGIKQLLGDGDNPGLPTVGYRFEETILGTGGGIRNAGSALCGEGPIVVSNSDFLSDIDLASVLQAHRASECLATLVLAPRRPGYSVVLRDADGRVLSLAGKPQVDPSRADGEYLFTGCHIIDEEVIERIPATGTSCIVNDVYCPLASQGRLGSYVHQGFWWEFGSPDQYLEGCLRLLAQPKDKLNRINTEHDPIRRLSDAVAAVGPGAGFDTGVKVTGHAAIGYGSFVSEHTHIEDSVVMPEAWIGPRCRIKRSIIAQGVELPAGCQTEEELICTDPDASAELPPSTRREAGMLVHSFATADAG